MECAEHGQQVLLYSIRSDTWVERRLNRALVWKNKSKLFGRSLLLNSCLKWTSRGKKYSASKLKLFEENKDRTIIGSCLLWVMSTEIHSVRQSIDTRSTVGRWSIDSEKDYRPSIRRYFDDAPRLTSGHMSVVYQSTVGGMSVNCRSNISRVLIYQVSSVALFFKQRCH